MANLAVFHIWKQEGFSRYTLDMSSVSETNSVVMSIDFKARSASKYTSIYLLT